MSKNHRIALVVSQFNPEITAELEANSLSALKKAGVASKLISVTRVPGAFEIPWACQKVIHERKPHAVIALGCIIRGETPHFDFIASACADGIMEISLKHGVPVVFGVLTTNSTAQARARLGKGREAAQTALQLLSVMSFPRRREP